MKIGLFGQFGGGNTGNDASLQAMASFLRGAVPDAELVCICCNPSEVEQRYELTAVGTAYPWEAGPVWEALDRRLFGLFHRVLNLLHAILQARGLDILIVPGTGFLDDFQENPFGWPFMIAKWCFAARLAGARLAFVSIGAGPIRHPISRWFMKQAARMCHFRSYRDEASRQFMRGLIGKVGGDPVFPDLVFRLPVEQPRHVPRETVAVGVGIMAYSGWARGGAESDAIYSGYIGKVTQFIVWLHEQGHTVRLLTGETADEAAVHDVQRRLPPPVAAGMAAEPVRTIAELMQQIGMTDIVVATRFHNIVSALKLNRPTISLSYARKNDVLLDDMGLGGFHQHVEEFDLDTLKRQFAEALRERTVLERALAYHTERYARLLADQDALLLWAVLRKETSAEQHPEDGMHRPI
jgi:polysaccharide pyruvyl transferase WcaK-like protein